jgi:hypothetical protein
LSGNHFGTQLGPTAFRNAGEIQNLTRIVDASGAPTSGDTLSKILTEFSMREKQKNGSPNRIYFLFKSTY